MSAKMTKGMMEAAISEAMIDFEKEYMGRGPRETKTYIIADMVLVRLSGVLTPAEKQLTKSKEGAELIKKTRGALMESARVKLANIIKGITSCQVKSLHSDISTRTGERIIIFVLGKNLEAEF